jgi:hypothetical protein
MTNPRRQRNHWLAFAVAPSAALIAVVVGLEQLPRHPAIPIVQGLLACVILLWGGNGVICALIHQGEAWGADRLRAGKDVLARWSVPADVWQQFRACEAGEDAPNRMTPGSGPSEGPIEVIVGKRALLVGEAFHSLRKSDCCRSLSWTEGPLPFLYVHYYVETESTPSEWCVRVPIPPGAEPAARLVYEHFRGRIS